jgi:hypothetical protein
MVNNSTNINKTNNHISPKESLNSDGQQFHQYQQNKQSHFTKVMANNSTNINKIATCSHMFPAAIERSVM